MKIGRWEVSEFIFYVLLFVILCICIVYCDMQSNIEKEKTKQAQIQENIVVLQQKGESNEV